MPNCPICKKSLLIQNDKNYSCPNCNFFINKVILCKEITPQIVDELCKKGKTNLINGFVSKNGKIFDAHLVLEGTKVKFKFPEEREKNKNTEITQIRVHSGSPGMVNINITGLIEYSALVDFGLVSSRMAECLGVISAIKFLKHYKVNNKIHISANNREFVEYLLKETTPRKKDMRAVIEYLWQELESFEWDLTYEPKRKTKLQGGTSAKKFPQGLFPWLKLNKSTSNDVIHINLPNCPAVKAQFLASIRTSKLTSEGIILPINSENVLLAWELAVTKSQN